MDPNGVSLPRFAVGHSGRGAVVAVVALVGWALVARCVHRVVVRGGSMAPSLLDGDRLVVLSRPWGDHVRPAPGDVVAIVGAGPIGLSAVITAQLFSPAHIVVIDLADTRLEAAKRFGADVTVNSARQDPLEVVRGLTDGLGADVAIEAVGVPETFELAAELIRPGGRVANVGVHGKPATLHLETLWIRDVTITTGLVDTYTTPTLIRLLAGGQLQTNSLVTQRFALDDMAAAYDTFSRAAETGALKVVLSPESARTERKVQELAGATA